MGVWLDNGHMIAVRKVSASNTDPSTLILDLVGEQFVILDLGKSIKRIKWGDAIYGIQSALSSDPSYKAYKVVSKSV